jgi:signal peptidase
LALIAKICNALGTAILTVIILVAGSILAARFLGFQPMGILSGSMEPSYHVGGLVFIHTGVKPEDVAPGDVIAFYLREETIVTHRVMSVDAAAQTFITKGDANNTEDLAPVPFESLIGKAAFHIPAMGYVLMNLTTAKGFAAGALLLAILIILFVTPVLLTPAKPGEAREKTGSDI